MGCRASVGGQEALSTDPRQNRGAQEEAAIEPPSGANTRYNNCRDSDLVICFFKQLNSCVTSIYKADCSHLDHPCVYRVKLVLY